MTSAGLAEPRGDAGEIEFNIKTDNLEADSEEPSNLVPTNSCSENPVDDVLSENQILENNIEDGGEIVGTNDPAMMQEFENQHETETMENVNINGSTENELINDNDMIHFVLIRYLIATNRCNEFESMHSICTDIIHYTNSC